MASSEASEHATSAISFETHPSVYRHLTLQVHGEVATLTLNIQEDQGLRQGYALKLNSYDLGVDIELADAVTRLRFEHPSVKVVKITSGQAGVFSAGANIFMLGSSAHGFKVNFCKFTNETRLAIEDATAHSDQCYVAALNGIASGGGYELALACEKIFLIDDKRSAAALPEVPYLGVLPGTGGLTRLVDKRKVRRDRADVFCTLAEGLKGQKAKAWNIVDDTFSASSFQTRVDEEIAVLIKRSKKATDLRGVELERLSPEVSSDAVVYRHVSLTLNHDARMATLEVRAPDEVVDIAVDGVMPASWYPLRMWRELDDALLRLRFHYPAIALVHVTTRGRASAILDLDAKMHAAREHWLVREVLLLGQRVLKRMDLTAKSFFALVDGASCFAGSLLELALASDRIYGLDDDQALLALSSLNADTYKMGNTWCRLRSWLLSAPHLVADLLGRGEKPLPMAEALQLGLVTEVFDELDWQDEIRVQSEERASLSPDALTGLEANLRFAGPETLETKIFGRLSAWQNWVFSRPNAVGEHGALKLYGQPRSPKFDWERT